MASPEVNGLEASENAVASPPLDTDLLDTAEQGVSVESHHDLMTFASANPEATAHGTSSGTTTHSPLDTRLPKNTQYYMPPGVQRLASKLSERRINIYGTPRSATTPLSPSAAPNARSSGSGEGSSSPMEAGDYDPISSDRELLIRCYAKARLPAWLRDFLPQISQYIARKMVDSAFPVSKEKRRLEENKQLNPCGAIHRLPHLLKDVEDGYSSFYDFITRTSENHGMPIDLVYSIACARKPYGDESMKVLLELSDAITSQVELAFKPWEGKAHSNTVELANGFEFKNFCEMAYNIWKHVIDEDSKFTSFPPAPGICGLPVTDFFKPIVSHFNHEETHCKVPITTLHHLIAELFEDALQAFKSVIDVGDSNAVVTELGLLADVVFCGRGATSSPATVSRHSALFGIFRKIAFIVQSAGAWRLLFSYCSIGKKDTNIKSFVNGADIDLTKLSIEKCLAIIASRFCVVLERPDLLTNCQNFFNSAAMNTGLNLSVISRHCGHSRSKAYGNYVHLTEAYSPRYTIASGTIYVPAKLRVSMILASAMILGVVYLWLSIKSASDGRFGNYVSMVLLLAGAVLGIGPNIMRRGWTYYDFVRWRMPIRGTSELGLHAYFTVLTVAKTYGVHISGRYTRVFPDSYRSSGGSLNVDVPIRLYDVQQSDTVIYGLDYDGTLVVQLHDKMTHLYSNNLNLPSTQIIETDPLADFEDGADARYKLQNILLG